MVEKFLEAVLVVAGLLLRFGFGIGGLRLVGRVGMVWGVNFLMWRLGDGWVRGRWEGLGLGVPGLGFLGVVKGVSSSFCA